ncbi:putative carbohydrate-binding protein with CBM5 and CBM33 domain, partial [Paracoccus denitrificans]|nr:putative carbohydrate-binding protein with CBM5 and CBM33 domain [Paracoccus denitrificans]
ALASAAYRFVPCSQGGYLGIYSDWPRPDLADVAFPVWFDVVAGADLPADSPAVAPLDPADRMNILHMVKQIYDHDDPLTEEQLRRRFSGRRLLW